MADVLSQSEIDELLSAFNAGNLDSAVKPTVEEERVRSYDFKTANRFSKEQIRTLGIVYETFGRLLETYLSGTLRTMCKVTLLSVEEQKYQEFINALPTQVMLAIIRLPPLGGSTLFEMGPSVVYSIISRLLGGSTEVEDRNYRSDRLYTEIEIVLLERILRQIMNLMSESWSKIIPVSAKLDRLETSSQFAQIVAMNETIVIVTLNVSIGQNDGLVNICIPHLALEPISKKLNTRSLFEINTATTKADSAGDLILSKLNATPLEVTAVFKDTTATVRDIMNLQKGDVIQLAHGVGEEIIVKIGHLPKFTGILGSKDKRYAIKINNYYREEEEENE